MRRASVLALLLLSPAISWAGECPGDSPGCGFSRCATPAAAPPGYLWSAGELRPVDEALPQNRDSTGFDEFTQRYSLAHPQWFGLDLKPPYLYALAAWGLQVWDLGLPETPRLVSQLDGPGTLREWSDNPEVKQPLRWIAIAGRTAAVVGVAGTGLSLFDLSAPTSPRLTYQDPGFGAELVAATTVGGRTLVVVPALDGARLYDATLASTLDRCLEGVDPCGPVRIGTFGRPSALYAAALGSLVAISHGSTPGLELYDLSDPEHPRLRLAAAETEPIGGVALFAVQGAPHLAYRSAGGLAIAKVLERTLESLVFIPLVDGGNLHFLTASESSGGPVLYVGSDNRCAGGLQREWLFDVSDPRNPRDLTPDPVAGEGYWGWYYRGNPTGFNNLMPRTGRFLGEYFYRAALSVLDIHRRVGSAPTLPQASFMVEPAEPVVGQRVTFRSTASGAPEIQEWFTPEGDPGGGAGATFVTTFRSPGGKGVSLTVCNHAGCDSASQTVQVAAAPGGLFDDLPPGHPAAGAVEILIRRGLMAPCAPRRFCPESPAGRGEIAELLGRLSRSQRPKPARGLFADLPRSSPAAPWIEDLYRRGRIEACGVSPLRFCPAGSILRGSVPAWFLRVTRGARYAPPPARGVFADLPVSSPVAAWVEAAYGLDLLLPCSTAPLRVCPRQPLSRGDLARWLVQAFDLV